MHKDTEPFAWQQGYGVFSLGERQREVAEEYVCNQKTHHQNQTTNAWLERDEEEDSSPQGAEKQTKRDIIAIKSIAGVREQAAGYNIDEPPF